MNKSLSNIKENSKSNDKNNSKNIIESNNDNNEEIDIFTKEYGFDLEFIDKMLNKDCKWKEKKEAFDSLANYTNPSKIKSIKNTNRIYFIEMVKKLLKQPNINVIHSIINALNNLSLGLNTNFIEAKDLFPYLLNFLKEKKETLINSLINCLCSFSLYMNDNILNEKLLNYCSTKPPLCNIAKINLCSFLEKMINRKNNIQLNLYISSIINSAKNLEDPNPNVREKTAKILGYISYKKKDVFDSIENSINLDDKKNAKAKIEEYAKLYQNLSGNNTNTKNVNININEKNNSSNIKQNNFNNKEFQSKTLLPKNNKMLNSINKINIDSNSNLTKNKKEDSYIISEDNRLNLIKENLIDDKEEIIFYVQKKIENLDNSLFNSLNSKERKEAFNLLYNFLINENNKEEINNAYDYYFKYILINNNFFLKEKNDLVLIESISCINVLIDKVNDFSKKYYKILIPLLVNILNEKKLIGEISNIIQKLSYKISSDKVIYAFLNNLKNKSYLIINEGIEIVKHIIDFSKNNEKLLISLQTQSQYDEIDSISKNYKNFMSHKKNRNKSNSFIKTQITKSPLLSTKKNISKYNYNIIDVLPPDINELPNYIKILYENDIKNKNLSLAEIKKILIHSIEKNNINGNQIKDILLAFNNQLFSIFLKIKEKKENIDKNEIILLRYLLDDYFLIVDRESLIINIKDTNFIYDSYEKLFLFLSAKEVQSLNNSPEILNIINKIILCLLTNLNITLTIKTLIKIISNYKSDSKNNLICSLAIKCLNKYRKNLSQIKNIIDNNSIFISLYEFFIDFEKINKNLETNNDIEKNALLMINSLITEYINIYNNSIWDIYHNSLDNNMLKLDIHFKRTIEVLMKNLDTKKKLVEYKNEKAFIFSENIKEDNNNSKEFIEGIMSIVNKLKTKSDKMSLEEQNNCYYDIVLILRMNEINISVLSNKIDGDIFAKLLEYYYGINSSKKTNELSKSSDLVESNKKSAESNINNKNKNENNNIVNNLNKNDIKIKKKVISEQSKRVIEYNNKIKYLNESNQKNLGKNNDENMQINGNYSETNANINANNIIDNTMKQLNEITLKNKEDGENNNFYFNMNTKYDLIKMKKKIDEIRKKLN